VLRINSINNANISFTIRNKEDGDVIVDTTTIKLMTESTSSETVTTNYGKYEGDYESSGDSISIYNQSKSGSCGNYKEGCDYTLPSAIGRDSFLDIQVKPTTSKDNVQFNVTINSFIIYSENEKPEAFFRLDYSALSGMAIAGIVFLAFPGIMICLPCIWVLRLFIR